MHRSFVIALLLSLTVLHAAENETSQLPILIRSADENPDQLLLNGNLCTREIAREKLADLVTRYGQQPVIVMSTSDMSMEKASSLAQVAMPSHRNVYITFIGADRTMALLKAPQDADSLELKKTLETLYLRPTPPKQTSVVIPPPPVVNSPQPAMHDSAPNRARDRQIRRVERIQNGVPLNSLPDK